MHGGVELCNLLTVWLCISPCMPTKEMVVYDYVVCSIEACALVYKSFDSGKDNQGKINKPGDKGHE